MNVFGEIKDCKLFEVNRSRAVVCDGGIFVTVKKSKVDRGAIDFDLGLPRLMSRIEEYPFVSRLVISLQRLVSLIVRRARYPKVVAAVIEAISIHMINLHTSASVHEVPMHRCADRHTNCVESGRVDTRMRTPRSAPAMQGNSGDVAYINYGELTLSKFNLRSTRAGNINSVPRNEVVSGYIYLAIPASIATELGSINPTWLDAKRDTASLTAYIWGILGGHSDRLLFRLIGVPCLRGLPSRWGFLRALIIPEFIETIANYKGGPSWRSHRLA